ncbi:MAG: class I SAM-dependent methyltransferase [Caldilineales bacterium]|nr:class I SAM-dependent methyltransferase [Caldilineales bacterium]MDW8316664.1 class I SAM-dependent methyltransferase [Anaerolineae bacterium]
MAEHHERSYTAITEMPGSLVTEEQRARLRHRYALARSHAAGRRVLEVACGAGLGLAAVRETAAWLVGGDYTTDALDAAQAHYRGAVPLVRLDAQRLPFADGSFDLVLCFEAIYYFPRPIEFLAECHRVLAADGLLLIGSENKAWPHFVPGPLSVAYYATAELAALLAQAGFVAVEALGAFPVEHLSPRQRARAWLRRGVMATGLFRRWPWARERLKPLVYRDLQPLSYDLAQQPWGPLPVHPLDPQADNREFKVIYALARRGPRC